MMIKKNAVSFFKAGGDAFVVMGIMFLRFFFDIVEEIDGILCLIRSYWEVVVETFFFSFASFCFGFTSFGFKACPILH